MYVNNQHLSSLSVLTLASSGVLMEEFPSPPFVSDAEKAGSVMSVGIIRILEIR